MKLAEFLKRQLSAHNKQRVSSPNHSPAYVLEPLEPRLLLSAAPVPTAEMPATEPAATAAVVTTDKADYSPGETAVITTLNTDQEGAKFAEGEMVQFQVTRTDGVEDFPMGNLPWYVTDGVGGFEAYQEFDGTGQAVDRNGDGMADWIRPDNDLTVNSSISTLWFVEDQYANSFLRLTATGQTGGAVAMTDFTDNAVKASITFPTDGGSYNSSTWTGVISGTRQFTNQAGARTIGVSIKDLTTNLYWNGSSFSSASEVLNATGNTANGDQPWTYNLPSSNLTVDHSYSVQFKITDTLPGPTGSSAVATANFNFVAAVVTTTTSVTSNASPSTYGDGVTFTATVTAASGTASPTGSVEFFDGATSLGTDTVANSTGTGTSTWSITTSGLNAGTHSSIYAVYTATGNFTASNSTSITQTVNKANATVVVTPYTSATTTYDGQAHTATVTSITGVNGETGATVGTVDVSNTTHTNAGTYNDTWSFTGTNNYNNIAATLIINSIAKASSTTINNGVPANAVYTGSAQGISGTTVTGAGGLATVATSTVYYDTLGTVATGDDVLLSGAPTNAGGYSVVSTYDGDLNHTGSSATDYFSIGKATLTGVATTQSALNIAKQGSLVFSLNNITGMVDGNTLVSLLDSMTFTLKIGANTYDFAPTVTIDTHGDGNASNDTVVVTYSLKNGGDAGQLAADLQALNISDGTASTSASNAQVAAIFVNMSTANYTFSDDALTRLFYSSK